MCSACLRLRCYVDKRVSWRKRPARIQHTTEESDAKGHLQVMVRQAALRSAAVPLGSALS
jgi:hypothetical protein